MNYVLKVKKILLFLCFIFFSNGFAYCQSGNFIGKKNVIYSSASGFFVNTIQFGFERQFRNSSLMYSLGYVKDDYEGVRNELQFRYYTSELSSLVETNKLNFDFYFAPYFMHIYGEYGKKQNRFTVQNKFSSGLLYGLRSNYNRFVFDFNFGGGFQESTTVYRYVYANALKTSKTIYSSIQPRVNLQIGFSF